MSPNTTPSAASRKSQVVRSIAARRRSSIDISLSTRLPSTGVPRCPSIGAGEDACGPSAPAGDQAHSSSTLTISPPDARRIDKIRSIFFGARQAPAAIVSASTWRTTNALSAFSLCGSRADLRLRLDHLRRSVRAGPSPRHPLPVGGEASIPYGWVDFCDRHPEECTLGKLKPMDVHLTRQSWKILTEIN